MANILGQTVAAKTSNESFHSSHSQQQSTSPIFAPPSNHVTSNLHDAALKAAGLPIYDVEAYLNESRNQLPIKSPPVKSPPQKKQKVRDVSPSSASGTPVQLGAPKTNHYVSALHQLCQERGLIAEYEIDGDQVEGFGGMVTIGGQTVASDQRSRNKKEAKEALAELGLPLVREMDAVKREKQGVAGEQDKKNWVGLLLGELSRSIHLVSTKINLPTSISKHQLLILRQSIITPSTRPMPPPAPLTRSTALIQISRAPVLCRPPLHNPLAPPPTPFPIKRPPAPTPPRRPCSNSSPSGSSTPMAAQRQGRRGKWEQGGRP